MEKKYKILCINPGSTSTKVALFSGAEKLDETNIEHTARELSPYPDIFSKLPMRKKAINDYLLAHGVAVGDIDVIAVRGGPVGRRYHAGAYKVDEDMYRSCLDPKNSGHAMCLAPSSPTSGKGLWPAGLQLRCGHVDELKDIARSPRCRGGAHGRLPCAEHQSRGPQSG
jgi:butyrate kinase